MKPIITTIQTVLLALLFPFITNAQNCTDVHINLRSDLNNGGSSSIAYSIADAAMTQMIDFGEVDFTAGNDELDLDHCLGNGCYFFTVDNDNAIALDENIFLEITVGGTVIDAAVIEHDEISFSVMFCIGNNENGDCTPIDLNVTNHSFGDGLESILIVVVDLATEQPIAVAQLEFTQQQSTLELDYCLADGCYVVAAMSETPMFMNDDVTITVTAGGQSVVLDGFQEEETEFGMLVGINSECEMSETPCEADFTFEESETPGLFNFNNESALVEGAQWLWEFGDGHESIAMNPTHQFTVSGEHEVCLTSYNENCTSTYCTFIIVEDVECNTNLINFAIHSDITNGGSEQLMYSIVDLATNQFLSNGMADYSEEFDSFTFDFCLPDGCYALMVDNNNAIALGAGTEVEIYNGEDDLMADASIAHEDNVSFSIHFGVNSTCTVGIDEQLASTITLYPNPATTQLMIQSGGKSSITSLDIMDMKGTLLQTFQPNQTTYTLNVDELATGMYFARIISNDEVEVQRFHVMH
jgi:PKD repeat protein